MSRFCIRSSPSQASFQAGRFLLYPVYHVLPALDGFGHESPRKCAETPRRYRAHLQKTENRPACGYRTVFCSIGIMGMAYFQSASLHLHYTTNGGKSRAVLHESSENGSKCLLPGGIAAENARQRKKGTAAQRCAAVPCMGSLRFTCPPAAPPARLSGRADGSLPRQRSRPRAARTGRWRSPRPGGRADSAAPARPAWRFPADGR